MPEPSAKARRTIERLAPRGSRARAALRAGRDAFADAQALAGGWRWRRRRYRALPAAEPAYDAWLERHRLSAEELRGQRTRVAEAGIRVGIDCLILAGEGGDAARTQESLKAQTLASRSVEVVPGGEESAALERLAGEGDGSDFLLVLEAGDVLEPDLLFNVAAHGWDDPSVVLVHWDDDEIEAAGRVSKPRFRPSWSPEMLLSANYLGRSFAVRRDRVAAAGGFGDEPGDRRWWDLLLRLGLAESEVARVPRILLHTARRPEVAAGEGAELIERHLEGRARVEPESGAIRVRWELEQEPPVSIVIPTRSRETLLARCLDALERTGYSGFDVVVVDSGERSAAAERFYEQRSNRLDLSVVWWEGPFNYSAANNAGARACRGEVLVFLNDDTEAANPGWLRELVGWARQPGVGLAGLQLLDGAGAIQHGGVVVGMSGFADHLFAGMAPGSDTPLGSTSWYRNFLSVTAACAAIERELFEAIGGFDERFVLNGSDVVLGLDACFHGRRNVCSPFGGMHHLEAATRGGEIPIEDFFSSYWRYQRWLRGGDPYFSPNLSLQSTEPRLRSHEEPDAMAMAGGVLGRRFSVFRQRSDEAESSSLAEQCRADPGLERRIREAHDENAEPFPVRTVNWFLLDIDSPFYGGINTAFRIAAKLAREHGVENQFVVAGDPNERYIRSAITAAFPELADSAIAFTDGRVGPNLESMPAADVSIATQWHTAYLVANFPHTRRRFYLIQDFEPMFYPAGTNYALAEEAYRFGLYGICNTERMLALYRNRYGGEGMAFTPAVDTSVFHAEGRRETTDGGPVTIFTYARPGHWRNCWELASPALAELKKRAGLDVRIVTAGSWARPDDLGRGMEHLGLLDYRETGALYRACDLGLALTVSEHPSYLPLELLACGAPVVAFDNPAGDWILRHEENSLRCPRTVDGLIAGLEQLATDPALRGRLAERGLGDIADRHSDWNAALAGIHPYLCDPTGYGAEPERYASRSAIPSGEPAS